VLVCCTAGTGTPAVLPTYRVGTPTSVVRVPLVQCSCAHCHCAVLAVVPQAVRRIVARCVRGVLCAEGQRRASCALRCALHCAVIYRRSAARGRRKQCSLVHVVSAAPGDCTAVQQLRRDLPQLASRVRGARHVRPQRPYCVCTHIVPSRSTAAAKSTQWASAALLKVYCGLN
jgi:hypothetical protein